MNDAPQQTPKSLPANLEALHRELEELFRQAKPARPSEGRLREMQGPVLVIRGK